MCLASGDHHYDAYRLISDCSQETLLVSGSSSGDSRDSPVAHGIQVLMPLLWVDLPQLVASSVFQLVPSSVPFYLQ